MMNKLQRNRWIVLWFLAFIGGCSDGSQIFDDSNASLQAPAALSKPQTHFSVTGLERAVHQTFAVNDVPQLTSDMYVFISLDDNIASFGFPLTPVFRKLDLLGVRFTYEGCGWYAGALVPPGAVPPPDTPRAIHIKVAAVDIPKVIAVGGVKPNAPNGAYTVSNGFCSWQLEAAIKMPFRIAVWAAAVYPEHFPFLYPGTEGVFDGYEYFSFLGSSNLIGVKDGRVYVHNNTNWNFLDVGAVTDFIPASPSMSSSALQQGR